MSLRQRLWSIAGLAFLNLVAMTFVDAITTERLNRELDVVQRGFVPLIAYGPKVEAAFDKLRRAMQDAVAAQDLADLNEAWVLRAEVLQLLDRAPAVVDRGQLESLRQAFTTWSSQAHRLSERLLRNDAGQSVVADIQAMHTAQGHAWDLLARTVYLDETVLARAFGGARGAQRAAAATRVVFNLILFATLAVMMFFIGRRVLASIAELRAGFTRFGAGDFSRAIAIRGDDELTELGASASQMARRIDQLQAGLRAKQVALEQVNRELQAFSESVSHDLRTPLRGIDGFSQALLEDYAPRLDATGRDYLERVRAAAQRMGQLIDDLLSLARIGRNELMRAPVDLTSLATRVVSRLRESDPARGVEWQIEGGLTAQADPRLVGVALENLMNNAWKFTSKRAQPRIEFGKRQNGAQDIYYVRDNGAGFDMRYSNKLFGAFQRLHHVSEFEGTGIGLATVSRIINKHGGRVWAEGEVEKGASFFFTLDQRE